jgi:hypothetical protein
MLMVHAECLKMLNRKDDYARMLLGLLDKAVASKSSPGLKSQALGYVDIESFQIRGQSILKELSTTATGLPYEITVPFSTYFQTMTIDPYIKHYPEKEGFQLRLKFRSVLEEPIMIDSAKLVLTTSSDSGPSQIILESNEAVEVGKGTTTIVLGTHVSW